MSLCIIVGLIDVAGVWENLNIVLFPVNIQIIIAAFHLTCLVLGKKFLKCLIIIMSG